MASSRREFLSISAAMLGVGAVSLAAPSVFGRTGKRLVVAVQDNPPQLDQLRLTTNVLFRVLYNVLEAPIRTRFGAEVTRVPGLAESWQAIDERTLEMRFRADVLFHDGSQLTSEDVAYTFGAARMGADLPGSGIAAQFFGNLDGVEVVDRFTVRFVTKTPDPLLELRLAGWASQIISKAAFERAGDWDRWALAPVGTGPYKVSEVKTGQYIELTAHDRYWGGKPPFASLRFQVVPEAAARLNGLLAGDYAIATEISPDQVGQIEGHAETEAVGGPIMNMRVLNFGARAGGPLAEPRIRQALALAIDRDLIVDTLFAGMVGVPKGYQWPAYGDMYVAGFPKPGFDPKAAQRLLREAGYDGTPIEYRSQTNYYTAELTTAQALVGMWEAVGLKINLKIVENWQQVFAQPNDAIFNGSINMVYPDVMGSLWPLYGPSGFIQRSAKSWQNDEFDKLGAELATQLDREKRLASHRRVLEIFSDTDPPGTVLHEMPMLYGKQKPIEWAPSPMPFMDFGPFNPALQRT